MQTGGYLCHSPFADLIRKVKGASQRNLFNFFSGGFVIIRYLLKV
jgi:hypothetical protein